MTSARVFAAVVVGCALGAALVLISGALGWGPVVSTDVQFAGHGARTSGSAPAGLQALGLAALAGAAGLLATRGRWRFVVAGLLVGLGLAIGAVVIAKAPSATAAPVLAAAGALLVVAAGLVTLARAGQWPGLGARYDAPRAPRREESLWEALERGHDPT